MLQALLIWLVLYAGLLAVVGFVLVVTRGLSGRPRSTAALLRSASMAAFLLALAAWVTLLIVDWP